MYVANGYVTPQACMTMHRNGLNSSLKAGSERRFERVSIARIMTSGNMNIQHTGYQIAGGCCLEEDFRSTDAWRSGAHNWRFNRVE
jgi:hypothetical protein